MFDRLDLFRDDTTPARSEPAPREPPRDAPRRQDDARERHARDGHRREYDTRRPPRAINDRMREATADVGMYRAVAYQDIAHEHFDGHPYTTRRAVDRLIRHGLLREHEAEGPQGGTYKVLTATPEGAQAAQRVAQEQGHDAGQQTWTGLVKRSELAHDTAVYRAAQVEQGRIEAAGGRVTRVRIDAELKQSVARATEKARAAGGSRAADDARRTAAQELRLPVAHDKVLYPDAQLEIEDREGRTGRVNVEIASEHYHAGTIVAKAAAGFVVHGSGGRASAMVRRALSGAADGGGGGGSAPARAGRDGSVEL